MDYSEEKPFEYNEQDPFIACVGENGGTDDCCIMRGFKSAVFILFNKLRQGGTEDELIYPLAYCCRHSIELCLKIIVNHIEGIEKHKSKSVDIDLRDKFLHNHSICELDEYIKTIVDIDKRIADSYSQISPLLADYFFDSKGDAFKYALGIDKSETLKAHGITSISITVLVEKYESAILRLENLISDSKYYEREYACKVFTEHLSRADIVNISSKLPCHDKWSEDSFEIIRKELCTEYSISNNELSKAINLIKAHQSLGAKISFEHQLGNITEKELCAYAQYLQLFGSDSHPLHTDTSAGFHIQESIKRVQDRNKRINGIIKSISDDSLKYLAAFCYVGKQYEFYAENFNNVLKSYTENSNIIRSYLAKKCQNRTHVIRGMELCGQTTYLEQLEFYLSSN